MTSIARPKYDESCQFSSGEWEVPSDTTPD
jgi:hypothetical protein